MGQTITGNPDHLHSTKYYGLTSFIIAIVILALSFKNLFDTILEFLANMFHYAPSGTSLDEFGTSTVSYLSSFRHDGFFSGLFLVTIGFLILIGLSYWACRWISHPDLNVWSYINRLATLTNAALPLELMGLFLSLIGHGFKLVVFLDLIAVILYKLGTIDNLWQQRFNSRQDRLYITAALWILYPVCFLIVLYLLILASR
ncbi:MAG: hypothetical protein AJITA_00716 [Acetilactobacillus jinshanensis]